MSGKIYIYPGTTFKRSSHGQRVWLGELTVFYHEEFEGLRFVRRGNEVVEFPGERHRMHKAVKCGGDRYWYVLVADYQAAKAYRRENHAIAEVTI